jgi:LPS sulfotransferase NodH
VSMPDSAPRASHEDLHSLTLVVSSARAGSTLLCHDIASLGGLGMAKEYLRGLRSEPQKTDATEADVVDRVATGVQEDAPGVAAVKLMVPQTSVTYQALTGRRVPSNEALSGVIAWARERFDRVFLVFLVRNAIDQAISRVVADATGIFHSTGTAFKDENALAVEIPDINQRILANIGRVARDRNFLLEGYRNHTDIGLLVTYDELSRQPDATAGRLAAHARAAGFQVPRDTVTRNLEKVITAERSTEIRQAFLEYLRTETGVPPESEGGLAAVEAVVEASAIG